MADRLSSPLVGRLRWGWPDAVPAGFALLVGQQETWFSAQRFGTTVHPLWVMSLCYAVAAAALWWRRRRPLEALVVVNLALGVLFVGFGAPDGLGDLLPPLIALYSVGRHAGDRTFPVALAVTALGVVLHEVFDPGFVFDGRSATTWITLLAAGLVGYVLRLRSAEVEVERERATLLERSRADDARSAADAERSRLARELHDLVGHGMSLAVLQVVAAQSMLESGDLAGAGARLAGLERTTRDTLDEVRRLLAVTTADDEVPPLAPQPSIAELSGLVEGLRDAGADVALELAVSTDLSPGMSLTVYRVVQEALTNVIRHAAAPARVRVSEQGNRLLLEVVDSGSGATADPPAGNGITGMRQRVALYGGTLDVSRSPGGGVRVAASLPLGEAAP